MELNYKYILILDEYDPIKVYKRRELYSSDDLTDIGVKFTAYKLELIKNKNTFTTYCRDRTIRLYCLDNYTGEIDEEFIIEDSKLYIKE